MSIKLFYLDDEEMLCKIFYDLFNSDQINVTTFIDANEAIKACHEDSPDVFLIDFRLPQTTGDKVAHATESSIPKILITGDITFESTYEFDQIISKPYSFSEMSNLINQYL